MRKLSCLLVLLGALTSLAVAQKSAATLEPGVVADLPAVAYEGVVMVISDGANHSDCATGSGSDHVTCVFHGGSWEGITARKSFGAFHSSTGATANTSGTPIKIAGAHTLSGLEVEFDEPVDGRLRYIGDETHTFRFTIHFSFTSGTNNINILLVGAKNGTVIDDSEAEVRIGTGSDLGSLSTGYLASLATNDYIEVFLDTNSGNPTITTAHLALIVESLDR